MNKNFSPHIPVLLNETIQNLDIKKDGTYIDCTFGYGGHSQEILKNLGKNGRLFAIDKDPYAVKIAKKLTKDVRFNIIHGSFSKILQNFKNGPIRKKVNGIILDLGVSSIQINDPQRGFSFINNGPLDMRMNPEEGIPAYMWLKKTNLTQLHNILKKYGEEPFSKRIAYAILRHNKKKTITRTTELSQIIVHAIPKKMYKKHPARRTFQAIRIYLNKELDELKKALKYILKILIPGGKLLIISFHSLEDRIVKNFMTKNSKPPYIPSGLALTEKQLKSLKKIELKIFNKVFPNKTEILKNPKSRSAILRIAEKTK